ncbi:MAG: retroviral-like aspartic protease family protein [Pseudomonadota bacterium]
MKKLLSIVSLLLLSICIIRPAFSEEIKMRSVGGVYTVPVRLNNALTMDFMIDTGAADIGLSDEIAGRLLSTGIMTERDFNGSERYTLADGSSVACRALVLRSVRIGGREVSEVKASACPGKAPLLLGQSFLKKLGPWALDYGREFLVVMSEVKKELEPVAYTPKDVEWQQNAGAQGDAAAQFNLAVMYEKGEDVPKDQVKVVELLKKSAAQGYAPAQMGLGWLYQTGNGLPKNSSKAFELFQKAAGQGFPAAQVMLGSMYHGGLGVPKNMAKAIEWYQKAAERGNDAAHTNLGMMYEMGDGVPKDSAKAAEWFRRGADRGGLLCQYYLAAAYLNGEGVPKDIAKGIELLQKASEGDLSSAQRHLGSLYYSGNEVPKNKVLAWIWTKLATAGVGTQPPVYLTGTTAAEDLAIIEKDMTPAEISQAQALAAGWKPGQALMRK